MQDPQELGALCDQCPLGHLRPCLPKPAAKGRLRLVVLAEAPGETELALGQPLVGASGQLFDRAIERLGLAREQVHITNTLLCRPPFVFSPAEWKQAIACCLPRLERELLALAPAPMAAEGPSAAPKPPGNEQKESVSLVLPLAPLRPLVIAAMGARALQVLTGKQKITDWIGAPLRGAVWKRPGAAAGEAAEAAEAVPAPTLKPWGPLKRQPEPGAGEIDFRRLAVLPMVHPAFVLREPLWGPVFLRHLERALLLAEGRLPAWRWPRIVTGAVDEELLPAIRGLGQDIGVDVETAGVDPLESALLNVGVSDGAVAISVDWPNASKVVKSAVWRLLTDRTRRFHFWNEQFDILSLEANGLPVEGETFDWMLAMGLVAPGLPKGLGTVACFEFHAPRWKSEFRLTTDRAGADRFTAADPVERAVYNAKDHWMTLRLGQELAPQLKEVHRGEEQFQTLRGLSKVAINMRRRGLLVDQGRFQHYRELYSGRAAAAEAELAEVAAAAGVEFNPRSYHSVRKLFAALGAPPSNRRDGKVSFDEGRLQGLCSEGGPIATAARVLLRYRKAMKLWRTYIEGLRIGEDGAVHPAWNVGGTITGRWSSSDPNMQNVPKNRWGKGPDGSKVLAEEGLRSLFVAREGCQLVEVDFDQLEAKILALLAGDERLLGWFHDGVDVHTETAKIIFSVERPSVFQRDLAKGVRYGWHYGATAEKLHSVVVVSFPQVALTHIIKAVKQLEQLHPDIARHHREALARALRDDLIEDPISGRRYYFHGAVDVNQVYNLPIQMAAAALINPALLRIAKRLPKAAYVLAQVHDSLLAEGPNPDRLATIMLEELEVPVKVKAHEFSFSASAKSGPNWEDLK